MAYHPKLLFNEYFDALKFKMASIWSSPLNKNFTDPHIFQKYLYTIYNKMRTIKATELIGNALESWDPQLSNAYPLGYVHLLDFVLL